MDRKRIWTGLGILLIGVAGFGCGGSQTPEEVDRAVLVDLTGKEWDVTHAVEHYGMDPDRFQYGLGPDTIRPVNDPVMLGPGNPDFPSPNEDFPVLGVEIDGIARAYRIEDLTQHEVANDAIGGSIVSPAY